MLDYFLVLSSLKLGARKPKLPIPNIYILLICKGFSDHSLGNTRLYSISEKSSQMSSKASIILFLIEKVLKEA